MDNKNAGLKPILRTNQDENINLHAQRHGKCNKQTIHDIVKNLSGILRLTAHSRRRTLTLEKV